MSTDSKLKKSIVLKIIPLMACSIILSIIVVIEIQHKLIEESRYHILEVNEQVAKSIEYKLKKQLANLDIISQRIEKVEDETEKHEFMKNIHKISELALFKEFHIVDKDGYTICEDKGIYLGDREYFKKALNGDEAISSPIVSRTSEESEVIINFAVDIEHKGDVIGVLGGQYKLDDIKQSLITNIYSNGKSEYISNMYLFDNNYNLIVSSTKDNNSKIVENKQSKIIHNGVNKIIREGKEEYLVDIDIFDNEQWHLITTVPLKSVNKNTDNIIYMSVLVAILLNILLFVASFLIIRKEYNYKARLENMAFKDQLTGIDNYDKLIIEVEHIIKNTKEKFVIICFDIKRFKFINQIFGYNTGDEILKQIAINIPKYIAGNYIYSRPGNDMFFIVISIDDTKATIEDLVNKIRKNIVIDGISEEILNSKDINVETSIGIYYIEDYNESIKVMIDYADLARQKCKDLNISSYYVFRKELLREKEEAIAIKRDISNALSNDEFKVYYQPKVCAKTEKVVGVEALIRWINKERGFISPDKFIPIAEKSGSITLIGKWVFKEVCKTLMEWKDKGYNVVPISINVSRVELYQSDFISYITNILKKYYIDPMLIEIEITETAALNDVEYINHKIRLLKELGIKVSMDDFGTGSSTLSNLQLIDIDVLKIDRSFLTDIESNNKSQYMVKTIIELSKNLGYEVVCEGVEYPEQVLILKNMDCDIIQGFVFYKPMNKNDIEEIIKEL